MGPLNTQLGFTPKLTKLTDLSGSRALAKNLPYISSPSLLPHPPPLLWWSARQWDGLYWCPLCLATEAHGMAVYSTINSIRTLSLDIMAGNNSNHFTPTCRDRGVGNCLFLFFFVNDHMTFKGFLLPTLLARRPNTCKQPQLAMNLGVFILWVDNKRMRVRVGEKEWWRMEEPFMANAWYNGESVLQTFEWPSVTITTFH